MLIRGQKKTGLVDTTGIVLTVRGEKEEISVIANTSNSGIAVLLGTYSTPEKYTQIFNKMNYCDCCGQKLDWEDKFNA